MRIYVLTQEDAFYLPRLLDQLLAARRDVIGIGRGVTRWSAMMRVPPGIRDPEYVVGYDRLTIYLLSIDEVKN